MSLWRGVSCVGDPAALQQLTGFKGTEPSPQGALYKVSGISQGELRFPTTSRRTHQLG